MPKEDIPSIEIMLYLCIQQVTRFSIFREVIRQYGKSQGPREKTIFKQKDTNLSLKTIYLILDPVPGIEPGKLKMNPGIENDNFRSC